MKNKYTFTLSDEANDIINNVARDNGLSRSAAIEMAMRRFVKTMTYYVPDKAPLPEDCYYHVPDDSSADLSSYGYSIKPYTIWDRKKIDPTTGKSDD